MFDKNRDGFIDAIELRSAMSAIGKELTEKESVEMIAEADLDHDGKINFQEFSKMLCS